MERDCGTLPVDLVGDLLIMLVESDWVTRSWHLGPFARILGVYPDLLTRHPNRWADLADRAQWTRLIAAAELGRPGYWPRQLEDLITAIGEHVARTALKVATLWPSETNPAQQSANRPNPDGK